MSIQRIIYYLFLLNLGFVTGWLLTEAIKELLNG